MNLSSKHQSMCKLEISRMAPSEHLIFIHASRKHLATCILWARIFIFDPETSLPDSILHTRWKPGFTDQRLEKFVQPKSKLVGKFHILAHRIHVYTFLLKFLIGSFDLKRLVSDISALHIDCGWILAEQGNFSQNGALHDWLRVLPSSENFPASLRNHRKPVRWSRLHRRSS